MANDFNKKNSDLPDEVREKLTNAVYENWDELVIGLTELAKGIWVQDIKRDDHGNPLSSRVYQQKPDKEAAKYLMDQVIGKAKENVNIDGKVNFIMDE